MCRLELTFTLQQTCTTATKTIALYGGLLFPLQAHRTFVGQGDVKRHVLCLL